MQAQQSLLLQQQELVRLLNASEQVLPLLGDLQKLAVPSVAGSEHPILQTQAQEVQKAVAARRLQKAQNLPDFWARSFYQGLYGIENPFLGFSITMNVPLFSKPLQKTKLSSLEVAVQTARLEQQKQTFNTLQTQAKLGISRAQTGLEYFETVGLQQAEEIIAAASLAYRSGELSYAELAQYLTQAISIRKDYLDNLNAYNQAVIEFLFLINQ
jgi:cobalt-zinc-cadmium resistance protein CzcA